MKTPISLLAINIAIAASSHAATLVHVSTQTDTTGSLNISVVDGKAATDFGQLGDGDLTAYRFWGQNIATGALLDLASGGSIISDLTSATPADFLRNTEDFDIWTTNDPGTLTAGVPAFDTTANFGGSTITGFSFSRGSTLDGTVDISGLTSGSVFFAHNPNYNDGETISLTMSGAGQTDLTDSIVLGGGNTETIGTTTWLTEFSFDNTGGLYDQISYTVSLQSGNTDGNFSGVMVDAVPEPSSFALLAGIFGLTWVMLRRR